MSDIALVERSQKSWYCCLVNGSAMDDVCCLLVCHLVHLYVPMNLKLLCGALRIRLSTCPFRCETAKCVTGPRSVTLLVVIGHTHVNLQGFLGVQ